MSGELGSYTFVVGNEGDRNDLDLWYKGGSMIENVAAQCSNTIVVIHSVGPVSFSWSNHPNITGIFYAGAPGEQTGPAIVDAIYGLYNPSGRLPFSIADVRLVHVFFSSWKLTAHGLLPGRKLVWNFNCIQQPRIPRCTYSLFATT